MISGAIVTTLHHCKDQSEDQTFISGSRHHHQTVFKDRPSSIIFSTNNRIISPEKCPSVICTCEGTSLRTGELPTALWERGGEKVLWVVMIVHYITQCAALLPQRHHHLYKVIKGISIVAKFFTNRGGCLLRLGGMYTINTVPYTTGYTMYDMRSSFNVGFYTTGHCTKGILIIVKVAVRVKQFRKLSYPALVTLHSPVFRSCSHFLHKKGTSTWGEF